MSRSQPLGPTAEDVLSITLQLAVVTGGKLSVFVSSRSINICTSNAEITGSVVACKRRTAADEMAGDELPDDSETVNSRPIVSKKRLMELVLLKFILHKGSSTNIQKI